MADLALVMPMAGRGSRFTRSGVATPKPLIELAGRPFFWWAVESVRRRAALRELVFVVLAEHVREHAIDRAIAGFYPEARVVAITEPTTGAAETAAIGVGALAADGPIAINDCDHAFVIDALPELTRGADGALLGFPADSPAYSYARLAPHDSGRVIGTAEKQVVGPFAIAGCYLFAGRATFERALADFRQDCPYEELYLSGLYDVLCAGGATVRFRPLEAHFAFGTPAELARVDTSALRRAFAC